MGLMTKDEYIESLRQMNPTAYMFGEKITNVVDNPRLRAGIEATAATYEVAELDEFRDLVDQRALESADTISDIHGGGSPEAHRVTIFRESDVESKQKAAKRLAGIEE